MVMDERLEQERKQELPILVMVSGSTTEVSDEQLKKSEDSSVVIPSGSEMDSKEEQDWNAELPIVVRVAGSDIDVREEQLQKA